ncbi:MFS transporter [Paraburkholderia xenovorans]|uniref:Major facilitator superfamily (MFS) transporter n=1 Tax=Paraburkholderia xenovorans (strain LB400) TaxID=266265 RepID=Q143W4_PARXL|nr:MFS transporter [Paraburkholderia xenovorans]ABE29375.1 major facilitator superfamily (MFS) transporter [Paraburkholderia xenovorans LB400]
MGSTPISTAEHRLNERLLAAAAFFSGAALRVCDSMLPQFEQQFQLDLNGSARVIVAFSIAYSLTQLFSGPLGDRFGKPAMVFAALAGSALAALASAMAPAFLALVCARAMWGIAAAGIIPLSMAWIGDCVPYDRRQRALARLLFGTLSGMMAGQLLGGCMIDTPLSWRGAFVLLAAGYLLLALQLRAELRRDAGVALHQSVRGRSGRFANHACVVLSARWARVVLLTTAFEGVFLLGPLAFIPASLHARFDMSSGLAAAYAALYAGGGLIYALCARYLIDRLGERGIVLCGGLLIAAGLASVGHLPLPAFAGSATLLVGCGSYLLHNTLQTHATQMAPSARGTAVSFFSFSLFLGQALGVAIGGYTVELLGYPRFFEICSFVMLVCAVVFALLLARRARRR